MHPRCKTKEGPRNPRQAPEPGGGGRGRARGRQEGALFSPECKTSLCCRPAPRRLLRPPRWAYSPCAPLMEGNHTVWGYANSSQKLHCIIFLKPSV